MSLTLVTNKISLSLYVANKKHGSSFGYFFESHCFVAKNSLIKVQLIMIEQQS